MNVVLLSVLNASFPFHPENEDLLSGTPVATPPTKTRCRGPRLREELLECVLSVNSNSESAVAFWSLCHDCGPSAT